VNSMAKERVRLDRLAFNDDIYTQVLIGSERPHKENDKEENP